MQRGLWTRTNNELISVRGAGNVAPIGHLLFFAGRPAFASTSLVDADSWLLLSYITCIDAGRHMNAGVGVGVGVGVVWAVCELVPGQLAALFRNVVSLTRLVLIT